jgi:hypothetical protein
MHVSRLLREALERLHELAGAEDQPPQPTRVAA